MTNGATIDSIEKILTGDEPLPERTSNTLLLAAIRANFQANDKTLSLLLEQRDDLDDLETAMKVMQKQMDAVEKKSNRLDFIVALIAGVSSSLGFYFGQK